MTVSIFSDWSRVTNSYQDYIDFKTIKWDYYSIVKKIHAFRILISNYCQYWYLYVWKAWKIYLYIWQKPERFTWMSDKGLKVLGMDSTGCLFPSWTIFAEMFTTNYQLLQLEQSKYWIDRETPRTNQHNVQQTCVVTWRDCQGCQRNPDRISVYRVLWLVVNWLQLIQNGLLCSSSPNLSENPLIYMTSCAP